MILSYKRDRSHSKFWLPSIQLTANIGIAPLAVPTIKGDASVAKSFPNSTSRTCRLLEVAPLLRHKA